MAEELDAIIIGDGTFRALNRTVSSGPSDIWIAPDGSYPYQIYGNASKLIGYSIQQDGSLTEVTSSTMRFASCRSARLRLPVLVTPPIEGLSLERELVIATVSGSTTPVEIRKIAQLASEVRMAVRTVAAVPPPVWKLYSQRIRKLRPAMR